MLKLKICLPLCSILILFFPTKPQAEEFEIEITLQERYFFESGSQQQEQSYPSIAVDLQYEKLIDNDNSIVTQFMYRFDTQDNSRTLGDIQELSWTHVNEHWEVRAGIRIEYWGITEAQHLVNIINQTDMSSHPDGEDKLGQPMINILWDRDWGTSEILVMPYFRERTFSGRHGRFRSPVLIDTNQSRYESSAQQWHTDVAFRWSNTFDSSDIALSYFRGTGRDPLLDPVLNTDETGRQHNIYLVPYYQQINQLGLEAQYLHNNWAWKLEAIDRSSSREKFWAASMGFEFTHIGIFAGNSDLGYIAEYLHDSRDINAPYGVFEQDILLALRWSLNDFDLSELLFGVTADINHQENVFFIESSRRFSGGWKLSVEGRYFDAPPPSTSQLSNIEHTLSENTGNKKNAHILQDSFIQIELSYFL